MTLSGDYETVIGLEVHVELKTASKIFCSCSTSFGAEPNTQVCPICSGFPGMLPVLNHKVVDYAIKVGLALNCEIAEFCKFDRKNYFYPDLPKAFQISQYDLPICKNGYLDIDINGDKRRIRITRIHMEEDAGKLVHQGDITTTPFSLVDLNQGLIWKNCVQSCYLPVYLTVKCRKARCAVMPTFLSGPGDSGNSVLRLKLRI